MKAPRVGKISYLNTEPFFFSWPERKFPLTLGVPRKLAEAARAGEIAAAPLPVVECWDMEKEFTALGSWGIAAKEKCESVLVFSRRPFEELNNSTIGLTHESSTSVVLCDVLIRHKYGHKVKMRRGLEPDDEAWLVIGDSALKFLEGQHKTWPYVTDLATEWWNWQKLPFVFARWVVRKNLLAFESELAAALHASLSVGQKSLATIGQKQSKSLRLPAKKLVSYLKNFDYVLSAEAETSILRFRELAAQRKKELVAAVA